MVGALEFRSFHLVCMGGLNLLSYSCRYGLWDGGNFLSRQIFHWTLGETLTGLENVPPSSNKDGD